MRGLAAVVLANFLVLELLGCCCPAADFLVDGFELVADLVEALLL